MKNGIKPKQKSDNQLQLLQNLEMIVRAEESNGSLGDYLENER